MQRPQEEVQICKLHQSLMALGKGLLYEYKGKT